MATMRLLLCGRRVSARLLALMLCVVALACAPPAEEGFDVVLSGGTIYDGSGEPGRVADVGIRGDRIAEIGDLSSAPAARTIDASGLAVAPGFINMLSWSTESLLHDGRSLGEIQQGVTLQVFGEGESMGPWTDAQKEEVRLRQSEIRFDIDWTTLGEYLESLERRGVSPNVASFVGATTVRVHELGYEDRAASPEELARMRELVRAAMLEGALGVGSSLIYAPAFYAPTEELIELSRVAAEHGGMYISHMRSEGGALLEAVDELLRIAREAGIRAEIYHLKAGGSENWPKMDEVIERVEAARSEGLAITADMYTYTAGSTGLDAAMPPWVQEGGFDSWVERLRDPAIRARVEREMAARGEGWENLYFDAGSSDNVLLVGFRNPELKKHTGRTVTQVAAERGTTPEATMVDLVIEDGSRVDTVYFLMSEENVEKQIARPWVSFGSDAASMAPEGVFLERSTHPRAYGNFARLLGRYVRERGVIPLAEAVRRLTGLPAENLRLRDRGRLEPGYFADVAVFDPATIQDHATFEQPHQLASGMRWVLVNGTVVLDDGEHTGAKPGRVVRGPGWRGWSETEASP
jgi:N-acyl-D-amino-acid deacylase